jgi:hypothetical protein
MGLRIGLPHRKGGSVATIGAFATADAARREL